MSTCIILKNIYHEGVKDEYGSTAKLLLKGIKLKIGKTCLVTRYKNRKTSGYIGRSRNLTTNNMDMIGKVRPYTNMEKGYSRYQKLRE